MLTIPLVPSRTSYFELINSNTDSEKKFCDLGKKFPSGQVGSDCASRVKNCLTVWYGTRDVQSVFNIRRNISLLKCKAVLEKVSI